MMHGIAFLIVMCCWVGTLSARQLVLTPVASARVANPGNAQDVQVLYRFELPEWLDEDITIVRARLDITDLGSDNITLLLTPMSSSWTGNTSWSQLQVVQAADAAVGVESATEGVIEADLSTLVREWAGGTRANHGFALTKRWGSVNAAVALDEGIDTPTLTIVYTRNTEE